MSLRGLGRDGLLSWWCSIDETDLLSVLPLSVKYAGHSKSTETPNATRGGDVEKWQRRT